MADIARITEVVEPEAKALGFELVRVVYFRGGEIGPLGEADEYTLQIMAERPETGQLVLDDCAALSHRISDRIDELEAAGDVLISDAYRLEVSSPGIVAIEDGVIAFDDRKSGRVSFPFADVQSAKLILTDRLIAATRPLETEGAEEIFEEQEDS